MDPGGDLDLLVVVQGLELGQRALGVLGRVERGVEVDLEVRRLGAQVGLGIARPGGRWVAGFGHGFDGRLDVLGGGSGLDGFGGLGWFAGAAGRVGRPFPRRGQVDGGLVLVGLAAVVGLDLVGVALLPARLALGELLVELARVEEDERRELDRARGRVDRAAVAGLDQQRDEAAMVEVGMGQEHGVEVGRRRRRTGSGCGPIRSGCPGTSRSR